MSNGNDGDQDQNGTAQGVQAGTTEKEEQGTVVGKPEAATAKPKTPKGKTAKAVKVQKKTVRADGKGKKPKAGKAKAPKVVKSAKLKASGKADKSEKAGMTAKKVASKADGDVPEVCPYRPTSSYGKLWTILHAHPQGITRPDLIEQGVKATGKPAKSIGYDVAVVLSPKEDGTAHRSANKAADRYYVVRTGDSYKLHLR